MGALGATMVTGAGIRLSRARWSAPGWKPNSQPPASEDDWETQFEDFQRRLTNAPFGLLAMNDFTFHYVMEWLHPRAKMALGAGYVLPMLFFLARGWIPRPLLPQALGLLGLTAALSYPAWKETLDPEAASQQDEPARLQDDPYLRLATQAARVGTFTLLAKTALDYATLTKPSFSKPLYVDGLLIPYMLRYRRAFMLFGGLVVAQSLVGVLMVNKGQRDEELTWSPGKLLEMRPLWRNLVENQSTVRAMHTVLAGTLLAMTVTMTQRYGQIRHQLSPVTRKHAYRVLVYVGMQGLLGMFVLHDRTDAWTYGEEMPFLHSMHYILPVALLLKSVRIAHSLRWARSMKELEALPRLTVGPSTQVLLTGKPLPPEATRGRMKRRYYNEYSPHPWRRTHYTIQRDAAARLAALHSKPPPPPAPLRAKPTMPHRPVPLPPTSRRPVLRRHEWKIRRNSMMADPERAERERVRVRQSSGPPQRGEVWWDYV